MVQRRLRRYRGIANLRKEFDVFCRLSQASGVDSRFILRWQDRYPCIEDRTATTSFDRHYTYHTAWAARILAETRPAVHVDIASSLSFICTVSAFVPIRFYDYRPADLRLSNLTCGAADLLSLPFPDRSINSLSCMHVVEHIGLGRYGDPLDPEGDRKAMRELERVLAPEGTLLIVVPVGRPRVCFNAHRIYSFHQVREAFGNLQMRQFALIAEDPASGGLILSPPLDVVDSQNYGCGCFWFSKPSAP